MAHIQRSLRFRSSAHDVFTGLVDVEAIPQWISNIKRACLTSPPPLKVGTSFVQDMMFLKRPFQIAGMVSRYEPDAEFAYVYPEGIVAGEWNYHITETDGGAQLDVTIKFHEQNRLVRLINYLLRPVLRWIINRNIDSFHAWVERKHMETP